MITKLSILSLVVILLLGCKSNEAFKYSEKIVEIENGLVPDITRTEEKVGQFFNSQQYDSAADVSRRMENIIDEKIKEIQAMKSPSVKEVDNFKRAFIKYFHYLKSLYTTYREFAEQTDDDEREIKRQRVLKIIDEKENAIAEMQRAQKKFAKANNFQIKG